MKNQNDMIIAIVCAVLGLIAVGAFAGTRPASRSSSAPSPVKVDKPVVAGAEVKMANSLPGAGTGSAGGRAGGGFASGRGPQPGGFTGAGPGRPGGGGAAPGAGGPPPAPAAFTGAGGGGGKG